ncbi:hypothetical protein CIB48_g6071 [Xylaria polymorpha]|nr:hypothetical protein CIB48_g6071 [Xylaria polymorpha]
MNRGGEPDGNNGGSTAVSGEGGGGPHLTVSEWTLDATYAREFQLAPWHYPAPSTPPIIITPTSHSRLPRQHKLKIQPPLSAKPGKFRGVTFWDFSAAGRPNRIVDKAGRGGD